MKLKKIWFALSLLLTSCSLFAQDENAVLDYIEHYKGLAIAEQMRAGVPASITLAQGIHESSAGQSELATKGNNHFGIKCKSTWMGETILHDDDKKQECFRKYVSAEQSYIDHSDFLKGSNRYHFLFDLERTDYAGWASGLKRAGYATNPNYVKRLTDLVEKYNLQQYTYEAISKSNTIIGEVVPNDDKPRNLTHVDDPATYYKGLKGFWALKGETLLPKALEKNIRYAKLLALNDLMDAPLQTDMFIFVEKKRKVGTEEFHIVKENENMLLISQKEAMSLSTLYAYNNLVPGQEPETGEKLALQYKSYETPKTRQQFLQAFEPNTTTQSSEAKEIEAQKEAARIRAENERISYEKRLQEAKEQAKREADARLAEEAKKEADAKAAREALAAEEKLRLAAEEQAKQLAEAIPVAEAPQSTSASPPISTEIKSNDDIIDAEKAKRMEQLLNSKPLDGKAETIVMSEPVLPQKTESNEINTNQEIKKEGNYFLETPQNEVQKKIEAITKAEPIIAIEPQTFIILKRKYDEPGVDDSVKSLKKKFDQIVYSPRPAKKIDTPKKVEIVPQKMIPEVKKQETKIPVTPAVKKEEEKKTTVQITKTGIKRDIKKTSSTSEKEVATKVKDSKKPDAKSKKPLTAKEKKEALKKEADAKKKGTASSKKESAKKELKKVADAKKKTADAKKKADTKPTAKEKAKKQLKKK